MRNPNLVFKNMLTLNINHAENIKGTKTNKMNHFFFFFIIREIYYSEGFMGQTCQWVQYLLAYSFIM